MLKELLLNHIVVSVIFATVICQIWKTIDNSFRRGKFDASSLLATGGMPSSHSTFVCALATSIGFAEGFVSTIFLLSTGLAAVVIRDALGVRHTVDELTGTINEIIRKKRVGIAEILKISGHTPVQVVVGSIIGIAVPIACYFLVFAR